MGATCSVTVLRVTSEYQSFHYMILRDYIRHGIFPFFNGNPFFSTPFGSFLRSMQIRFNNFRGRGGGFIQLFSNFYGLSILPLCDFCWLLSTLNIAICDASLLLSPSISTADVSCTRDQQYNCIIVSSYY